MHVFIDESGIHKQDGQSTTALVYVEFQDLGSLDEAVLKAEKDLKIESFHWSKQIWKIRQSFLEAVIKEKFEVKIFILQNPVTKHKLETAWKHLLIEKNINSVVIDGKKSRAYSRHLKTALRHSGISVKKVIMGNDKAFPGLRLADLFAGIVRVHTEEPENEKVEKLYSLAKNKITIRLTDGQVPDKPH